MIGVRKIRFLESCSEVFHPDLSVIMILEIIIVAENLRLVLIRLYPTASLENEWLRGGLEETRWLVYRVLCTLYQTCHCARKVAHKLRPTSCTSAILSALLERWTELFVPLKSM